MSSVARFLGAIIVVMSVAGCAAASSGASAAIPLTLSKVTDALRAAGIVEANVADNLDPRGGAWECVPGRFRLARISQQPVGALFHPGDGPSVDVLLFSNDADRAAAQAVIGSDGQTHVAGCGVMVDWVGAPHVLGVRNVIVFVATDDPGALSAVEAAIAQLGR